MKKGLMIIAVFALAALVLWASPFTSSAQQSNDDPDVPRLWKNVMSKEEYKLRREEHVSLLRGIGTGLPFNPSVRMRAIDQLNFQQRRLFGEPGQQGTGGAGTQTQSATSSASAISGTWTPIGPFPIPNGQTVGISTPVSGRTVAVAIHPTNPDIVYVGTAQGGLYRSTNGGTTWIPMMDGALSLAIGTLTLAPSNPEILFVGTGEQTFSASSFFGVGVYRIENASSANPTISGPINRDAANNDVFSGRAIGDILVHPTDPNIIFVSTTSGIGGIGPSQLGTVPNRGLFRSTNAMSGAPSFTKLAVTSHGVGENRAIVDLVMDPGNPNRIVASVVGNAAIATTNPPQPADNGGLFLSTNALAPVPSFAKTLDIAGTTSSATRTELAINRIGSAVTIYAASAVGSGTIYRSSDGGETWTQTVNNSFCSPQCFYDIAIGIDPTNANRVYLGGSPALAFGISTNGGASFTASENGLHADSHVIEVAPSNPQVVYFGSDGGIYRSDNAGANWTSLSNSTFSATQFMSIAIHPSDPNFTIGGTQDNGTEMLRFDGTWTRTDYGDGGYAAIDQSSPAAGATMYHTYYNSNALGGSVVGYAFSEDTNAFENWSFRGCQIGGTGNGITCTDSVLFYAPLELGPGSPNTVYYGTDRLYRSDNKGLVHTIVSQAPIEVNPGVTTPPAVGAAPQAGIPISSIGIGPTNDNIRLVGLRNGGIWGTTNGSATLTNLDPNNVVPNVFVARAAIDPNNPNTAYVTLSAFGVASVWKTTSLSAPNWTPASGSADTAIPQVPVNAFVIDPTNSNRLIAGTDIGVYSSEDGGTTWTPVGTGLPRVAIFDMGITSERKLRIATHGRGMWEILLPGAQVSQNPIFAGVAHVIDSQQCDRLTLSWLPANSTNPSADIVYDIYRVSSMPEGDGTQEPRFAPSSANQIASGVRGATYADGGLTRNQPYYYIVHARDLHNGRIDTNNNGNRIVRVGAPTSPNTGGVPLFAKETFDTSAANSRFTPGLQDSAAPNQSLPAFQRVQNLDFGGTSSAGMYAPDFSPGDELGAPDPAGTHHGAVSDFSAIIGPFTVTADSIMEFDHRFNTESGFDGGVMEVALGVPSFNATPFPDNVTTFDLGNHMIQNGYNGKLDGLLVNPVMLSPLQGRRAFTGSRGLSRTKISLRAFANGGPLNPSALPVYIRFRMTSDAASTPGVLSGWYIDNVSISDLSSCVLPPPPAPNVTSLVSLATANPGSSGGVSQYDLTVKNVSAQAIYAPLRLEVASISSSSGRVTVANADNGQTGAGAGWDYSTKVGGDNTLSPNETSWARTLKFNNPNNEAFTVNFRITGYLDPSAAAAASGGGSSGGGGSGGSEQSTSSGLGPASVMPALHSLTYNPLLKTVTSKLLK
ncbi:MAG TPA: hypothetical protein VFX97_02860 [Pyrinomonadaceae bacterium]|nr:hypothetical protein [Pyrinomonadaceae bacterium]